MIKDTITVNSVKKSAFASFAFASLVALSPAHAMDPEAKKDFPTQIVSKMTLLEKIKESLDPGDKRKCERPEHLNRYGPGILLKYQEEAFKGGLFTPAVFNILKTEKFNSLTNAPTEYALFQEYNITWYADVKPFDAFQGLPEPIRSVDLQSIEKIYLDDECATSIALEIPRKRSFFFLLNDKYHLKLTGFRKDRV